MTTLCGLNFAISDGHLRGEYWQAELKKLNCSLSLLEPAGLGFAEQWKSLPENISWISIAEPEIDFVLSNFQNISSEINLSQNCDALLRQNKVWWVKDFWSLALVESIVRRAPRLDTHGTAYVTGGGRLARAAVVNLIKMGFSRIVWVTDHVNEAQEDIISIKRKFFAVAIEPMAGSDLTLQPNNGTILVNTIGLNSEEPLLQDLFYLNFLRKNGVAVDIHLEPFDNQLLTEAETVGVFTVPAWYLVGVRDCLFLNALLQAGEHRLTLDLDKYLESWKDFLKTRLMSSQK